MFPGEVGEDTAFEPCQNEGNSDARSTWRRLVQALKGAVLSVVQGLRECIVVLSIVRRLRDHGAEERLHVAADGSIQRSVSFMRQEENKNSMAGSSEAG